MSRDPTMSFGVVAAFRLMLSGFVSFAHLLRDDPVVNCIGLFLEISERSTWSALARIYRDSLAERAFLYPDYTVTLI